MSKTEGYEASPVSILMNRVEYLLERTEALHAKIDELSIEQNDKLDEITDKIASLGYEEKYGTDDPLSI